MGAAGRGKKRIRALVRWHFGEGDAGHDYCNLSCAGAETEGQRCKACPYRKEEPRSDAGESVWDVITRLGGQLRVAPMGGVFGLDYGAALALGTALSADMELLAEILPDVEAALVRRANGDGSDDAEVDHGE